MNIFYRFRYILVLKKRSLEMSKRVKILEDTVMQQGLAIDVLDKLLAWCITRSKVTTLSLIDIFNIIKEMQGAAVQQSVFGKEVNNTIKALGDGLKLVGAKNTNLDSVLKHLNSKVDFFTKEDPNA